MERVKRILLRVLSIMSNLICIFGGCYAIWMLARVFLFASYKIPTESMIPAILPGDNIIVNKMIPGGRIFNILDMYKGKNAEIVFRFPGMNIKRNDILVFNSPKVNSWDDIEFNLMLYYAKRCVALPGDTFFIESGIYKVKGIDYELGNVENQKRVGSLSAQELNDIGGGNVYPFDNNIGWNAQNMGPIYIPKKGDIIKIDKSNYRFYRKYIDYETGQKCLLRDNNLFIGDSVINEYRFNENYYFMAGDNAMNSEDSRFWGFVPEKYIAGKAFFIWKSKNPYQERIRWDRVGMILK